MKNNFNRIAMVVISLLCIAAPFSVALYLLIDGAVVWGIVFLLLSVAISVFSLVLVRNSSSNFYHFYNKLCQEITTSNSDAINNLQMPVVVMENGIVKWYNSLFRTKVLKGNDAYNLSSEDIFGEALTAAIDVSDKVDYEIDGRYFTVYKTFYSDSADIRILYFIDDTNLKITAREYSKTRPVVSVLSLDAFDESTDNLPESQKAAIKSAVGKEIEIWANQTTGFIKRINSKQYLFILDEQNFELLKKSKFDVLDRIRNLKFEDNLPPITLSIGVGRGVQTLRECEILAFKALEMAQGRGGDQAAIKTPDGYEFFGGIINSGKELTTKVKARVVASALKELIRGSDTVYITGHKFPDLDCLGSALALFKAARYFNIDAHIVMDKDKSLAPNLVTNIEKIYGETVFSSPHQAIENVTRRSLVIVVDTHRASFMECPEILNICPTCVVIDHHRKNADYIEDAVIFYHEPSTSSTCEMVTELLQYIGDKVIEKPEANALLAGITLDTRNFVLSTGVRTFEASAYLKRRGADTVEVKKLFAESVEVYKEKSELINSAEIYKNCAISCTQNSTPLTRISASKAADELLGIKDILASFIIYANGNTANISARSYGGMNVQLIMEQLGGGGHHTMAACQLNNTDIEIAKERLTIAIDQYIQNTKS